MLIKIDENFPEVNKWKKYKKYLTKVNSLREIIISNIYYNFKLFVIIYTLNYL